MSCVFCAIVAGEAPAIRIYEDDEYLALLDIRPFTKGHTLVAASSLELKLDKGWGVDAARTVGSTVAERAKAKGIAQVVYDRGGNLYHGRVAALAEAAREGGLDF